MAFPCFSQTENDSLQVIFDQITIDTSQVFRGLNARFPHPVISIITVKDTNQRYVHGLADTTRWVGPGDLTESGLPVDSVWKTILEYHEEDPAIPADPDVKKMTPDYQVTELFDVEGFGLSLALVMDYSGSMGDDIYISEDAARVLVRRMTSNDRAAIIKFAGKVQTFQDFTSDTTLLMEAISKPTTSREYTSLFDALYTGVDLCTQEESRRVVVAYTDGMDNYSSHGVDDVVTFARANEIPIFMIGLGGGVDESNLRRVAEETGGVYMYADSVEELASIYLAIYGLISGYYIMAHSSTDPFHNNTWRIVDLTLDSGEITGHGTGRYFVPYQPADLLVSKEAVTDSVQIHNGETLKVLPANGTVTYQIQVTNQGPAIAGDVIVKDRWPPEMEIRQWETPPDSVTQDSIFWSLSRLDVGESSVFAYTAGVDTLPVTSLYPLVNHAVAECPADSLTDNNRDSTTVWYTPLLPVDISVSKHVFADSLTVSGGDTVWYVLPGESVVYQVTLENRGELDAGPFTCRDELPPQVTLTDFSQGSYTLDGDTLSWTVSGLASRGGRIQYSYTCRVDTAMPPWNVALINRLTAICPEDSMPGNNTARDTVWAVGIAPPDPRIRVSPSVVEPADSVEVEVMTPVHVEDWDLIVRFQSGYKNTVYADDFIQATSLVPGEWTRIIPDFSETYMTVSDEEERVAVIFETRDRWAVVRSDTAYFTIRSSDAFFLDENVFRPASVSNLGMRFKLNSNRWAEIRIYDISGAFVASAVEGPYRAGWNYVVWDGRDSGGKPLGSGTYVAILTSGSFQKARKFILVR
jgi:VWFA-related protein